ncbi:hypothetical protein MKEN_01137300 [Mycena kentingensis (nom. inval.)]|nr:hypothetical protein MKEN_01137300 [Mycena kentingensis (nom. inval.)]
MRLSTLTLLGFSFISPALALPRVDHEDVVVRNSPWLGTEGGIAQGRSIEKRVGAESVQCYDEGTKVWVVKVSETNDLTSCSLTVPCSFPLLTISAGRRYSGQTVTDGNTIWMRYDYGDISIYLSGTAINGCSFTVDDNCSRLLMLPVDKCNQSGENGKQGGIVTDICGQWRTDPGDNTGNDY